MTELVDRYSLKVSIFTPLLGSQPTKDVASNFLAKKAPNGEIPDEEMELLPDALERGTTTFHQDGENIYLMAYQIKGFLKNAGKVLNDSDVTGKIKSLRSKVANTVFVIGNAGGTPSNQERKILLIKNGNETGFIERSLRAETPMGSRIALARSESVGDEENLDEGNYMYFYCEIHIIKGSAITEKVLRTLLDYGRYQGIGQWRGGDFGKFTYELEKIEV